ncbi:MAG: Holliday junction branch migration protein RuvA [Chloroflexi bacterium]|nr:MAG: Holliday junction branch migration protein RuvA [Chloroflexota bacterium]
MIRFLRGVVLYVEQSSLVIEPGGSGLGLRIYVPNPTIARTKVGDIITLHTYLQVRENELSLYGFETPEELQIFELLLGVSGVGPKVALSALSTLSPDAFRLAVANKEPGVVARVPGIGKRTAEKIVIELQGKLSPAAETLESLSHVMDVDMEVIEALVALGYSVVEAQRAVQQIPPEIIGLEERLREALRFFSE